MLKNQLVMCRAEWLALCDDFPENADIYMCIVDYINDQLSRWDSIPRGEYFKMELEVQEYKEAIRVEKLKIKMKLRSMRSMKTKKQ